AHGGVAQVAWIARLRLSRGGVRFVDREVVAGQRTCQGERSFGGRFGYDIILEPPESPKGNGAGVVGDAGGVEDVAFDDAAHVGHAGVEDTQGTFLRISSDYRCQPACGGKQVRPAIWGG